MKPEILERQIAHAGYVTVERLRMRLTDGAEVSREVERHGDAAAVLPYDVERRSALVVRLFRAPVLVASGEEMSEEACAGMIENEDADTTARREAYEELGVDLPSLEFVARVWSSPGVSTERQSLFLAPYRSADRISDGGGVEGEREGITVVERLLAELAADVDQGRTADGKLLNSGSCATPAAARPLRLGYFSSSAFRATGKSWWLSVVRNLRTAPAGSLEAVFRVGGYRASSRNLRELYA